MSPWFDADLILTMEAHSEFTHTVIVVCSWVDVNVNVNEADG
jgi:hypothetical protein